MSPHASTTWLTRAGIAADCCRSATTVITVMPLASSSVRASANSSALRALSATLQPISPSAWAICRPSPREPPVIKATWPSSWNSCWTPMVQAPVQVKDLPAAASSTSSGAGCQLASAPGSSAKRRSVCSTAFRPTSLA